MPIRPGLEVRVEPRYPPGALGQWRYCPTGEAREGIEVTLTFDVSC